MTGPRETTLAAAPSVAREQASPASGAAASTGGVDTLTHRVGILVLISAPPAPPAPPLPNNSAPFPPSPPAVAAESGSLIGPVFGIQAVSATAAVAEQQTGVAAVAAECAVAAVAPQQASVAAVAGGGAGQGVGVEAVADQPTTVVPL